MKKIISGVTVFVILFLVAIILYYPVFNAGYVWDDNILFVDKVKLVNEPLSWKILTEPVLPNTTYFRPLIFLTIYFEFYFFGQNPLYSHITNLFILVFNAFLISLIVKKLLNLNSQKKNILWALFAGLLYLVNPVLVEATAWISGRFDLLVTTFTLLATYIYVKNIKFNSWGVASLISLCFFCALLSKELGIIVPAILFCIYMYLNLGAEISYKNILKKYFCENSKNLICFLFTLILYFYLRIHSVGDVYHQKLDFNYINQVYFNHYLPVHSLFFYIKQFFLPFQDLTPLIPMDNLNQNYYSVYFKSLVILFFISVCIFGVLRKNKYIYLVFVVFISISLVIYLIPITIANNIAHNRFMTLGLAFYVIFLIVFSYECLNKKIKILLFSYLSILLISSIFLTKSIVGFWKNDYSLWYWVYVDQPENDLARNSYLYGLASQGYYSKLVEVVNNYISKNGSLSIADQLLYINALISTNDPEALNYAKGVDVIIAKPHKIFKNNYDYKINEITNYQFSSFYSSFALAKVAFENDFKEALSLNDIALWYLDDDQKIPVYYSRVAFLYKLDKKDEAKNIFEKLGKVNAFEKEKYINNMFSIIYVSCINSVKNKQSCEAEVAEFNSFLGVDYEE